MVWKHPPLPNCMLVHEATWNISVLGQLQPIEVCLIRVASGSPATTIANYAVHNQSSSCVANYDYVPSRSITSSRRRCGRHACCLKGTKGKTLGDGFIHTPHQATFVYIDLLLFFAKHTLSAQLSVVQGCLERCRKSITLDQPPDRLPASRHAP